MNAPLPTTFFTDNAYFYANNTFTLGSMQNPVDAVTLITVDYTQLEPAITILDTALLSFLVDQGGGPPLSISNPVINNNILTFLLSKGIANVSYTVSINILHDTNQTRSDFLIVNIFTNDSGPYGGIPPVTPPASSQVMIGSDLAFLNTGPRYFVGSETPEGPNIMDEWWNPITAQLAQFITDGTNTRWYIPVAVDGIPAATGPGLVIVSATLPPYSYTAVPINSVLNYANISLDMGTF